MGKKKLGHRENEKRIIGDPSDIAKLDFHDWHGNLMDRMRGKVTEKNVGVSMIQRISDNFGITLDFVKQKIWENQQEELKSIQEDLDGKDMWHRDSQGNIESPFKSRKWKDGM